MSISTVVIVPDVLDVSDIDCALILSVDSGFIILVELSGFTGELLVVWLLPKHAIAGSTPFSSFFSSVLKTFIRLSVLLDEEAALGFTTPAAAVFDGLLLLLCRASLIFLCRATILALLARSRDNCAFFPT